MAFKKSWVYFHLGLRYTFYMVDYSIVRGELSSDLEADFVSLGRLAYEESSFSSLIDYDEAKMLGIARTYSISENKVLFIASDGDVVVGIFAGYHSPWFFSNDSVARDVVWYVREEYRSLGVGIDLLSLFEDWSWESGASAILLGQDSGIDTTKFSRILESKGYGFIGANYSLRSRE